MRCNLRVTGLLAVFALACTAGRSSIRAGPYLQSATPSGIWIVWETASGEESTVVWGPSESLGEESVGSARQGRGRSRVHEVQLTGLSPDTTYFYQVRTGARISEIYDFHTPPDPASESAFRLLAMSDMQMDRAHRDQFSEIVSDGILPLVSTDGASRLSEALALTLIPGDLVDDGRDYSQWADHFFGPAAPLLAHVPTYPVMGNHEDDSEHYLRYFHLPENGTEGYAEHWYYTDYSNLRVIGLDSNSDYRLSTQLDWLRDLLDATCEVESIDFVFAQLHHPFQSELWLDGETEWSGEVVALLEDFSSSCDKPSLHFFGHTHGYSRGQSLDHNHLWVNVATAGGKIDYWGEYDQTDYDQFSVSQDEWGFVLVELTAGEDPSFTLQRISRGSEDSPVDNLLTDEITIRRINSPPESPAGLSPGAEAVHPDDVVLVASPFEDVDADLHGASHWQLAADCVDFDSPLVERWVQHENWYFDVDTQAGDDLEDETMPALEPSTDYCWRVRYRDRGLVWSDWSEPLSFTTTTD